MSTFIANNRRPASKGRQPATNVRSGTNASNKKGSFEKTTSAEGCYGDARFTHYVYTLVGMTVQVQVKNGTVYEGIFKTISPEMNVVIELAHKVEENGTNCSTKACPTRDMIIDNLVLKKADVVTVTCLSVDLDYAAKDTFTDAAISRGNNGQAYDMELQPWDGEAGDELALEDGDSANGWDPNEMFKTNQERYNVESSYDDSLTQYTTALNKEDTKEFRKREDEARRIAREIEKSDDYRRHIDLENGDDEEAMFSAVHRGGSQSSDKKYIPPRRNNKGRGNGLDSYPSHNKTRLPVQHQSPSPSPQQSPNPQQQQQKQQQVQKPPATPTTTPSQHDTPHVPSPVSAAPVHKDEDTPKMNGGDDGAAHDIPIAKTSQNEVSSPTNVPAIDSDTKNIRKPTKSTSAEVKIQDLKKFQTKFVLGEKKESEKKPAEIESRNEVTKSSESSTEKTESKTESESKESGADQENDATKKFTLNPLAQDFVPKSTLTRVHPNQAPSPSRPQTQSPVIQPMIYPYSCVMAQPSQAARPYPKKAIVSVGPPDYRTAAQHATGQPLLAGTVTPYPQVNYMVAPQMLQQHSYSQVIGQPPRMVSPGMGPSSHSAGMDPNQGNSQTVYMTQGGPHPVPAHMGQQGMPQTQQTHVAHPGGNPQNQGVQMTQVSVHHPAPSPVQHVQGGQGTLPGQVPPTAGTPQPMYNSQMGIQGHPGLHGSHNPTSPQTMHPASNPYSYTSHPPQFTFSQGQPTSVSHTMPNQIQSPHVNPVPVVMMHPPSNQHQFTGHMGGPTPIHGQGHIMHPGGVPGQGHTPVPYLSHMSSQGPSVMAYQQNQ